MSAIVRIEHNITQMPEGFTEKQTITPELAATILSKYNTNNRQMRPSKVSAYAQMMRQGNWRMSPEALSFSRDGRLLNGQHRLSAVVDSGTTQEFLISYGYDDEVFQILDRGALRSTADALGRPKRLVECGKLLTRLWDAAQNDFEVDRACNMIEEAHGALMEVYSGSVPTFSSAPFRLAAVARVLGGAPRQYAFGLYADLCGARTEVLPPIGHAAIRHQLAGRFRTKGSTGGVTQNEIMMLAWRIFDPASINVSRFMAQDFGKIRRDILEAVGYAA